jgi:hypothetical protein
MLPSAEPYPSGPEGGSPRRSGDRRTWMTAAQLFGLYQALPLDSLLRRHPESATEPLRRWAEANPALATRYPAADILRQVRWAAHHHLIRLTPLPLAGTYRFTVELSDGQHFTFYARTEAAPSSRWEVEGRPMPPDSVDWPRGPMRPPAGYWAETFVAPTEHELPRQRVDAERRQVPYFSFRIGGSPSGERGGVQSWRGAVDFAGEALPVVATDSASLMRLRELAELARQVSSIADPREMPATFERSATGAVEVRQKLRLHDGRLLTIRGVRVSDTAVGHDGN